MSYNSKYKGAQVEELLDLVANGEVDNVYVTDFTFYDLFDVFHSEGEASKAADIASLLAAAQANKIIIVPISSEAKSGCVANMDVYYDEDIELWFYYYNTRIELRLSTDSQEITFDNVWMEDIQSALISGENIKTINGEDILGEGDIELATKEELEAKQDAIADLDAIRSGAEKGATALQSIPSEYVTETELTAKGYATTSALNDKVDKVSGKQLSTEDFTSALKAKLEGLSNYDDTTLSNAISGLETRLNTLVSGDASTAIESFNEIMDFLDGIKDTQDLASIIASIEQQIASKQDKITDLDTIRSGAAKGATALQSYTEKYTGTITGITMNGASKGTSGVVDLGTVITAHQDISGKADKSSLATVATSGSYNDLTNKPTIPSAVTESTVSGWGFTKNTGTYSKPSTGIPKTDLASAVQTSLGKADTALQSYTEQYKGTITGVSANGTSIATSGVANIPAASTSAYGVTKLSSATNSTSTTLAATASAVKAAYDLANGKQDKLVSGTNIKTINGTSLLGSGDIVISGGGGGGVSQEYVDNAIANAITSTINASY
jgi:hypothetical protein